MGTSQSRTVFDPNPLDAYSLEQLSHRASIKWTEYDTDVLPMWVAEMDGSPVPEVIQVVSQILAAGDTGYPGVASGTVQNARDNEVDYRLLPSYAAAYAQFAHERWGLDVPVERVHLMPDVMQGVMHAVAMLNLKKVVINTPVYPPFRVYPAEAGAELIEADLTPEGRIDFAALEEAFKQADGYLLCNPHNPTGVAHTPQELERVFELADVYDVRVVVDEIHAPLTSVDAETRLAHDPFTPVLSVKGSGRAVVLFSAAKGFNLAGFKAALMIVGPDAEQDPDRIPPTVFGGAATVSIAAHTAALVYGGDWLDAVREAIDARREQLVQGLAEIAPAAKVLPAEATYFAWVDFSQVRSQGEPLGEKPAHFLRAKARVAFNEGVTFGRGGAGHARINLATSAEVIDEALRRIAAIVD